ncbi:MAG: hypothetical protein ACR2RF_32290 [Geminicoccaceae bacterium]
MAYCLICERQRANQGPRENKTYVNVAPQSRIIGSTDETLDQYQAREPDSVWFDPGNNEFLIEISKTLYNDIQSGTFPLLHDGYSNLPVWQQQNTISGDALSLGSYDNPEDSNSAFVVDRALPDDRFILRIYDKDPVTDGTAVNIGSEEFLEDKTTTTVERFLRLFQADETPVNRNVADDRLFIDGAWLDLDWGSSDGLGAGVARFFSSVEFTGEGTFSSDAGYQVLGPTDETRYTWTVYTKTLNVVGR